MTRWTCLTCDPPTTGTGDTVAFYRHWTPAHYAEAPRPIPAQREPATGRASGSGGLVRAALLAEREARLGVETLSGLSDPRLTLQGQKVARPSLATTDGPSSPDSSDRREAVMPTIEMTTDMGGVA